MTEDEQRAAVIREALSWVGTPFHWEGAVKKAGVDCGRFLACTFNNAGVKQINIRALPHISPQWFMHRGDESYLNVIRMFATEYELEPGMKPKPGDLVIAHYGKDWAHSAIVIDWPKIIGASPDSFVRVWNNVFTSPQYQNRRLKFFDPWRSQ